MRYIHLNENYIPLDFLCVIYYMGLYMRDTGYITK